MSENYQDTVNSIDRLIEETITTLRDKFIEDHYSEEVIDDVVEKLRHQYATQGIRIRVIPAPTKKATVKKEKESLKWVTHPGDSNFSYTEDFILTNGIPLRNNKTCVIVGAIDDEGPQELVSKDIATCATFGCKAQITKIGS